MRQRSTDILFMLVFLAAPCALRAQANYDESEVPKYTLPDPLVTLSGERVTDVETWRTKRRPEILELFHEYMYGRSPAPRGEVRFAVRSTESAALGGKAIRKLVRIAFTEKEDGPGMDLLLYVPKKRERAAPAFLGLNFGGNHTVHEDPAIPVTTSWVRNRSGITDNRATDKNRGAAAGRWQVELLIERGYALATIYYGDIDPDFHDEFKNGVHALFAKRKDGPKPSDWSTISAWAWGLSRALDYLEEDPDVDAKRVAVIGHSRLGKTSLWAGAQDERFALVISNDSGCGGAALSRRAFGETVKRINTSFPHWFCAKFKEYNDNESKLPLDQHMLIALMAPRPIYVASAAEDRWADPRGEFLSAKHATPVYALFGLEGLPAKDMPAVDKPSQGTIGYHCRTGGHDVTRYDWERYLEFADRHLRASR